MENDVLVQMAQDMQIVKYIGETYSNYIGRVIYSAICHWMRYAVLDKTTQVHDKKSKKYVLRRIKEILVVMLETFPDSKKWIIGEPNELIRDLRTKMIAAGELVEVGKSKIGLPIYERFCCTDNYDRVIGLSKEINNLKYVGITRIIPTKNNQDNNENNEDKILTNKIMIDDYIKWIYARAAWNECYTMEKFEFFNEFSQSPPNQLWSSIIPKRENKILARVSPYNGLHEYYLIKKEDNKYWSSPITNILASWKEERRILLALRKSVGNKMQAMYENKGSVYLLNLYCGLPLKEQILLDTYCWPLNSMDDKYNYVVPKFIWKDIEDIIINGLGINLKEKNR